MSHHYYAPMTTGMGLITFEEVGLDPYASAT